MNLPEVGELRFSAMSDDEFDSLVDWVLEVMSLEAERESRSSPWKVDEIWTASRLRTSAVECNKYGSKALRLHPNLPNNLTVRPMYQHESLRLPEGSDSLGRRDREP